MATIALSIDVMLPALGEIASEFGIAHDNRRQLVIVTLFVGLAAGQLIFGPLSDAIGRRPAITVGAVIFAVGGGVCALSSTFEGLIAGRLLQGFGAAGPRIVTVALMRDRFEGRAMAQVMSIIMGTFIMVPVLAPSLGQALLVFMSWRGLFGFLSVVCLLGTVWLLLRQPETHVDRQRLGAKTLKIAARQVVTDRCAMAYTLAGGFCYGALMGYIGSSQQLFQETYRVGDLYVILFGVSAAFVSAATFTNSILVKHVTMEGICVVAVGALVAWSAAYLAIILAAGSLPPLWAFMLFNCPALFMLGLTFGNFSAIALQHLGHIAGLAAAMTASLLTLVGVVGAALIGFSFDGTVVPIVLGYLLSGLIAVALMRLCPSRREPL
ncbi:MAG: multidrug effflux MFS transporter [Pseudomonadota bacterium]